MNSTTSADVRMHPRSHTPNPGPRLPRHPSRQADTPTPEPADPADLSDITDPQLRALIERRALLIEDQRQKSDYLGGFRDGALLGAVAMALVLLGSIGAGHSMGWL